MQHFSTLLTIVVLPLTLCHLAQCLTGQTGEKPLVLRVVMNKTSLSLISV